MKTFLVLLVAATAAFAYDPACVSEWQSQRPCFWDLLRDAFGINEGLSVEDLKETIGDCYEDNDCSVPPYMMGGGSGAPEPEPEADDDDTVLRYRRHARGGRGGGGRGGGRRGSSRMRDFVRVKDCVQQAIGQEPFEAVKDCVKQRSGVDSLPPFMNRPPRFGLAVLHNKKCPYLKMMKFLAISERLPAMSKRLCGNDETKATAVKQCILEGTGVDISAIDRDSVKDSLCENKDSCYTEKLTECRDDLSEMMSNACTCKEELANEALTTCARQLSVELPEELTMPCDELLEQKKRKFDMCNEQFEWPSADEIMRHHRRGGHGHGHRGHGHGRVKRHGDHHRSHSHGCDDCNDDDDDDKRVRRQVDDSRDDSDDDDESLSMENGDNSDDDDGDSRRVRRHNHDSHDGSHHDSHDCDDCDNDDDDDDAWLF
jgi:hypothetical protein